MDGQHKHRVVITGGGCVSCLGIGQHTLRDALQNGRSGIGPIAMDSPLVWRTKAGGQVDRHALSFALAAARIRNGDIALDTACLAADEALAEARAPASLTCLTAVSVGAGASNVEQYFKAYDSFFSKGSRWVRPTTVPRCMNNAISAQIAIRHGLGGANQVVSAACASSTMALGHACRMIRHGYWRSALCVGADTIFSPFTLAAWDNLGVMSRSDNPARASRPFDRDRDGCVIGEGAAAIFLESWQSAKERSAPIRAEICGYGESADAYHITTPDRDGQARAMQEALQDAGIQADALGWVHAHGTATIVNDSVECESLKQVLGTAAQAVPVSSLKPYYGHMLGASGTMDLLASVLALEDNMIPPTLNLDAPDDAGRGVLFAPATRSALTRPYVMKCSFGFGGSNAVLIVKAVTA
jgi:3-oxoacyl-[acyl-carrier-protein] synthase II